MDGEPARKEDRVRRRRLVVFVGKMIGVHALHDEAPGRRLITWHPLEILQTIGGSLFLTTVMRLPAEVDARVDLRQSGRGGTGQRGEQDRKAGQLTRHDAKITTPRREGQEFDAQGGELQPPPSRGGEESNGEAVRRVHAPNLAAFGPRFEALRAPMGPCGASVRNLAAPARKTEFLGRERSR